MTPAAVFTLTFAPALVGAIGALACDARGAHRAAVAVAAAGLAVSGVVGMWASLAAAGAKVFGVARVGGLFSAVPGVIALLAAVVLVGGWDEFAGRTAGGAAAGLVALAAVASGLIAASYDLTLLLVALETVALCAYALVSDARTKLSDEAAMKYFVQGSVATGAFVLGLAVLVGIYAPSGAYAAVADALKQPQLVSAAAAGAILVLATLAFKLGAAPFHSWAPDAYQSARPEVSAFLSAGPKLGAIAGFMVFVVIATSYGVGALTRQVVMVIAVLAVLSVLVGSLLAFRQRSFTRMLGYAGVAQAGYALIGVAVLRAEVAVFFGVTYAIATTGTFLAAAAYRRAHAEWDGSIAGLAGLGRQMPLVSASLAALLVSLAGIPPLLGFWGKLQVFAGAAIASTDSFLNAGDAALGWTYAILAAAGILGSIVSLGYYGGVLRSLYLDASSADEVGGEAARREGSAGWAVAGLAVAVFVLGAIPLFFGLASVTAPFLLR